MQQRTRAIGAAVLIATGLVWIGQGSGVLKGSSFMVGDPMWIWAGLACVAGGAFVGYLAIRRSSR